MSALGHTMASMTRGGKMDVAESSTRRNNTSRSSSYTNNTAANKEKDKGQNINHLMAFTLPPRLAPPSANGPIRRTRRGGGSSVPFNKERYVNAQYRFLVKPTGDYTAYFADSDIYLNWSDILTVLIPTTSALSTASHVSALSMSLQPSLELHEGAACPICLSPPTAPRMTKCGHVYCYPCILHYLTIHESDATSGTSTPTAYHNHVPGAPRPMASNNTATHSVNATAPKWKRCPVCWDAVYAKDLKAVQWWDAKARALEYEREEEARTSMKPQHKDNFLCMRLIERPHLTTLALPQSSTWPNASTSTSDQPLIAQHSAPWHFQPDVMTFCKFMLATPDQLLDNLSDNLKELEEEKRLLQSFGMKDEVGLYFVELAERKVQEQMEKVMNELDTSSVQSRIGFAKNELREHAEIERGIKERNEEAMSKREKKRREREKKINDGVQEEGTKEEESKEEEGEAKEFLQFQAQNQGGAVLDKTAKVEEEDSDTMTYPYRRDGKPPATKTRRNLNPPAPSSSSYFFFQASSGQNIFLHPLDIKVLLSIYGSYSSFPRALQVPVQGADEGSMNEEIKKKCKYLTHLTKGTDIVFVEVDWDAMKRDGEVNQIGVNVDRDMIKMYDQALRQRKNRRKDRERREDRAKLKWEETEKNSKPISISNRGDRQSIEESQLSAFTNGEEFFPSSLGSTSAVSPTFRESALLGAEQQYPIHPGVASSEDEFPATNAERDTSRKGRVDSNTNRKVVVPPTNTSKKTVWGTPAARSGSFANALHNSSRNESGITDDDRPDWDAWLELEEDFIVGARNGTTIREGRGLNKQNKKGISGESSSEGAMAPSNSNSEDGQTRQVPGAGPTTTTTTTGKQQKKKKLVLTSGAGMRGR